jgi:cellulose synthase/poly-beta-1,6-N-acetylglucosamine synthase-like glycosyltransferase
MIVLVIAFWASVGLLIYAQVGYAVLLLALERLRGAGRTRPQLDAEAPSVSVIVAAYAEEGVIGDRVRNLRELDYAGELEVIVACDGSPDETAERARQAGADLVLELPREGKTRAQDAAVQRARGEVVAFSDANVSWEPSALEHLVGPFADPRVGYVCGNVLFVREAGTNQEGVYWRYEMALRALESRLRSVTAGNGAIYATRRAAYVILDAAMSHDLSFPFNMVKSGWLAVYEPRASAREKMIPTIEGEFARKRRMMRRVWPVLFRSGILSPRGYDPLYALMIVSHRVLRYATPLLHLVALGTSIALIRHGPVYVVAVGVQGAVLVGALLAGIVPLRPLLLARYYVLTTASLAAGLWDWLRHGTPAVWEPAEGAR